MKKISYILILSVVLFITGNYKIAAQTTTSFPLGTWATGAPMDDPVQYDSIKAAGFNWIVQSVNNTTKPLLTDFNIITQNASAGEWIYYYSNGKYKRWEAERSEYAFLATGMKHPPSVGVWNYGPYRFGNSGSYDGDSCWITHDTLTTFVDSVLWGPNYTQAKNYKMQYNEFPVNYTVKYRLALRDPYTDPQDTICYLYVRYRAYKKIDDIIQDTITITLDSVYLLAESFADTNWRAFYLHYNYPEEYRNPTHELTGNYPPRLLEYYDDNTVLTGIEFCLDYWGKSGRKLYMDYVEVYDNEIWIDWIDEPTLVMSRIDSQLSNYPPSQWQNLKYWYVSDEPPSLDEYEPIRIVDSLVYALSGNTWRTINQFHPGWNAHGNGDKSIKRYKELAGQERLMIDYFPFWENETDEFGFRHIRPIFEQAAEYAPGFFYVPQGFGQFVAGSGFSTVCGWREPSPEELKASIFFALSFGAKGIQIWKFATSQTTSGAGNCDTTVQWKCLAKSQSENYELYPIGQIIRDDIAPRLNGVLGSKLLDLDYSKLFATLKRTTPSYQFESTSADYLTLSESPPHITGDFNFHAGLFDGKPQEEYFLLTNLLTQAERRIRIIINKPYPAYTNYRIRDIETDYRDFTFNSETFYIDDTLSAGEGRLYQVAPVVRHGGRLIADETVGGITLTDDMTIENEAVLSVNGTYTCQGNIIIKDGGRISNAGNGKLLFEDGKRIIVEGRAFIEGFPDGDLIVEYNGTGSTNGVELMDGAELVISYTQIKNFNNGITNIDLSGWELTSTYNSFDNCITSSHYLTASIEGGGETLSSPVINYCNIDGSGFGIFASNLPGINVLGNSITNTNIGLFLSQVSDAIIVDNDIIASQSNFDGIIMLSSGGNIRENTIKYHNHGIQLGNSSPTIGANLI